MKRQDLKFLQPGPAFLLFFVAVLAAFVGIILRKLLAPIVFGVVAAVVFYPFHRRIERRFGAGSNRAALLSLLLISLFVGVPIVGAAFLFVAQARQVLEEMAGFSDEVTLTTGLARLVDQYLEWIEEVGERYLGPAVDLQQIAAARLQEFIDGLYSALPDMVEWLGYLLFAYMVFIVVLFFLLRDGSKLGSLLVELSPLDERYTRRILDRLEGTIRAVFVGGVLTAVYQATLGGLGFWLTGFDNFAIWGVFIFVASFVPVFGSGMVWAPAVLYLALIGHSWQALLLLGVGAFISTSDNLLRLILIGHQTALHPLVLFLAAFGGLASGGPIGLIYGMLLAATLVETLRIYYDDFAPFRVKTVQTPLPPREEALPAPEPVKTPVP